MKYLLLTDGAEFSVEHKKFYKKLGELLKDPIELLSYSSNLEKLKQHIEDYDFLIFDLTFIDIDSSLILGYCYQNYRYKILLTKDVKETTSSVSKILFDSRVFKYDLSSMLLYARTLSIRINKMLDSRENARHVVLQYYEAIQNKKYIESWSYLDPDYTKEVWNGKIKRYLRGYKDTKSIQQIKISYLKPRYAKEASFLVTYVDDTNTIEMPQFKDFYKMKIINLPRVLNDIEELKKQVENLGYSQSVIDNLTIHQMSQSNLGNVIQYLLEKQVNFKLNKQIKGNKNIETTLYSLKVDLRKIDSDWFIYKIVPYR